MRVQTTSDLALCLRRRRIGRVDQAVVIEVELFELLAAAQEFRRADVAVAVPQGTIDQWMPLKVDPDNTKITRVALVMCFRSLRSSATR